MLFIILGRIFKDLRRKINDNSVYVSRWIVFTLSLPIFSFAIVAYSAIDQGLAITSNILYGRGELFIMSCAIAYAAFSEVTSREIQNKTVFYVLMGAALAVAVPSAVAYGLATVKSLNGTLINGFQLLCSCLSFLAAIIIGFFSVLRAD
jgi:uncharacterized membrane protein YczE